MGSIYQTSKFRLLIQSPMHTRTHTRTQTPLHFFSSEKYVQLVLYSA